MHIFYFCLFMLCNSGVFTIKAILSHIPDSEAAGEPPGWHRCLWWKWRHSSQDSPATRIQEYIWLFARERSKHRIVRIMNTQWMYVWAWKCFDWIYIVSMFLNKLIFGLYIVDIVYTIQWQLKFTDLVLAVDQY